MGGMMEEEAGRHTSSDHCAKPGVQLKVNNTGSRREVAL